MKKKDLFKEIKGLSTEALVEKGRTLAEELMKLRFRKVTGQLETPHQMFIIRRNLARVQTAITASRKSSAQKAA